jgi:GT2 family glycosyltransferase
MWPEGTKLGWAMPLTWPYINAYTHISTLSMHKPDFVYLESSRGGDIAEKREAQVELGLSMDCTHILLLDGDMVFPENTIPDLFNVLEDGADMAGGLCYRGYPPYNPLIWHPTEERQLVPFVDYKFGDVVDAGATGAACLLIKREVFEKLERPWFRIQNEVQENDGVVITVRRGEDTYFCRKATKAGFKLRIMTEYDIGHIRELSVDRHFWLNFQILNRLGSWEKIIQLQQKLQSKEWIEKEFPSDPKGGM